MMNSIIKPIITEKSMRAASTGRFTFAVLQQADKASIKRDVEDMFKVDVTKVQTVTTKGLRQRVGKRRVEQQLGAVKKAIVSLKNGQKIDLFDIQTEETK